jgi:hypothetical protein
MKKFAAIVGVSLLTGISLILLLSFYLSYASGYSLVIENQNAASLDLFFVASDGGPATSFTQFHQQVRRFPKISIPSTATLPTSFESSGEPPVRAIVRRGDEFRIWRFAAQTGGHVILPPFDSLPAASATEVAQVRQNLDFRGIIAVLIQSSVILLTLSLWLRIRKKRRTSRNEKA